MENPMLTDKHTAWTANYQRRRTSGQPGWGSAQMYEAKTARLAEAIQRHGLARGTSWLDLGCGAGNLTDWLAGRGFLATGIDCVAEAIAWAQAQGRQGQYHLK